VDRHPKRLDAMANTKTIPDETRGEIARQIKERLVVEDDDNAPFFSFESLGARGAPSTSALDLAETFEVWRLSPAAVRRFEMGKCGLGSLAKPTGSWHHQIKLDNDYLAFARSSLSEDGGGGWSVEAIFVSPIAKAIDTAIEWTDNNIPDDKLARLLTAPAYHVMALWFVNEDAQCEADLGGDVLIVTAPSDLPQLAPLKLLDSDTFLEILRQQLVGMGIGAKVANPDYRT
jgi:hypothetical protein